MRSAPFRFVQCTSMLFYLGFIQVGCGGNASSPADGATSPPTLMPVTLYGKDTKGNIESFSIDTSTGNLTAFQTVAPPPSDNDFYANLLIAAPSGKFLFTDDENYDGTNVNYRIDGYSIGKGGSLSLVNGSPFAVPSAFNSFTQQVTSLAVNSSSSALYAVNRGGTESISEFQINSSNGALTAMPTIFTTSPSLGPTGSAIDPSGKFLYVTEDWAYTSGSVDASGVSAFSIDSATGNLTALGNSPFLLPASSEPQSIVTDPSGNFLYTYLWNARSLNDVAGFVRDLNTGALTSMPGSPFASSSSSNPQASAFAVHPSGKFLFVENFNGGTVTAFAIDQNTGVLSQVAGSPFPPQNSKYPSGIPQPVLSFSMAVDPTGKYLYLAGLNREIAVYQIDQSTGALTPLTNSQILATHPLDSIVIVQTP